MIPATIEGSTSKSLLSGLRNREAPALARVAIVYGPLIKHWCRKSRLSLVDVDDVCQNVLLQVVRYAHQFRKTNPNHSLRKWLYVITQHEISRWISVHNRVCVTSISPLDVAVFDSFSDSDDDLVDPATRKGILLRAVHVLHAKSRKQQWEIFYDLVWNNDSVEKVAAKHNTSPGNVRVVKTRMLARLRDILEFSEIEPFEM